MKNVRVKVGENCDGTCWWYGIYEGRKKLMENSEHRSGECDWRVWWVKFAAIRNAKAMAKRIGIKYDPEIIKQKGC